MFRLAHTGVVRWPVELLDVDDQGDPISTTVRVSYRILTRAEQRQYEQARYDQLSSQLLGKLKAGAEREDLRAIQVQAETLQAEDLALLRERVVGWAADDVQDQEGQPVPFSAEALEPLMQFECHYRALFQGLLEASRAAVPKTSSPGPAGVRAQAANGAEKPTGAATATLM